MQLLHNDIESKYFQFLGKGKKNTMRMSVFRNIQDNIQDNPAFMADIFKLSISKKPARKQNILKLNVTGQTKGDTVREV